MENFEPKIYVACLAAYNNGYLHGAWIDATLSVDEIWPLIQKMLATSPIPDAEEWAIHDHEDFCNIHLSEHAELEKVSQLANFIAEHGKLGGAVLNYTDNDIEDARTMLEDCYHGEFNNEEDFAYYWINEVDGREIPEYLVHYIDYQAIAQDFFVNDFLSIEVNHQVHVFSYC